MRQWLAGSVRVARGLWPGRNPLRRGVDRMEAAMLGAVAVAFLIGAPLCTLATAHWAYGTGWATARAQRAALHQVPTTLLEAAPPGSLYTGNLSMVRARWVSPDGTARTGTVLARSGSLPGTTVMAWMDDAGQVADAPLTPSQVRNQALLTTTLAPAALACVLLCGWLLGHRALDRRRAAAWESDWRATEPQWSHRH
jgi:hypothetical protein